MDAVAAAVGVVCGACWAPGVPGAPFAPRVGSVFVIPHEINVIDLEEVTLQLVSLPSGREKMQSM